MIGIYLSINYTLLFFPRTKIQPLWLRGVAFGFIPWFMAQIIVMPMMNIMNGMNFTSGLFSGSTMMAIASLVGHLIFGAVLDIIYRNETKLVVV